MQKYEKTRTIVDVDSAVHDVLDLVDDVVNLVGRQEA